MGKYIVHDHNDDGIDRRGFLKCMAWAGTGIVWTAAGGLLTSKGLGAIAGRPGAATFTFVQISDSHIGFDKEANKDVVTTLREAVSRINALPTRPDFVIHTGDLTHLSKPGEFDTLDQVLREMKTDQVFFVPGEHDVLEDDGAQYLARHGKGTLGHGWYSFDHRGVHFVGLVNVVDLKAGGLGLLGAEQLQWLERDVKRLKTSTPIVVFAHIPLWTIYPQWGWGTDDSAQALGYLKRFGSVTVLNGHIHQVLQKVEGRVTFHTAMSTAFPQPAPGAAPGPGPMKVPAEQLRHLLGLRAVDYVQNHHALAIVDSTLASDGAGRPINGMEV
jgi:3',5'-cyclic-AMP phosphodiesterase